MKSFPSVSRQLCTKVELCRDCLFFYINESKERELCHLISYRKGNQRFRNFQGSSQGEERKAVRPGGGNGGGETPFLRDLETSRKGKKPPD